MMHRHGRILALFVLFWVAAHVEAASFHVPKAYLSGNNGGAAVADFNGDGKADVAAANGNSNTVSILLGNGDGSLQNAVNYVVSTGTGASPISVVARDFNGDGKLDLAVLINSPSSDSNITVLLGNGDGTFQPPIALYLPTIGAGQLVAADFNGDGKLDLAIPGGASFLVALGNGDGTFGSPTTYRTPAYVTSLAVGDFDGDGKPDMAVTLASNNDNSPGIVQIWLNAGGGTLSSNYKQYVHPGANNLAVADLNGDGILDLAITCENPDGALGILLGNGDGTFRPPVYNPTVGTIPTSIAVGDLNGDGKPDVAVTAGLFAVDVLLNQGGATFKLANTFYPGGDLIVADMNGDGQADLVLSGSSVVVLLGGGNGTFQHVPRISLGHRHDSASGNSVSVADFNGDGKLDLAVTDPYANAVLILAGNGDGTFQSPVAYNIGHPNSIAVGDFNGDGKLDLVVAGSVVVTTNLYVLFGNGDGTFQPPITLDGPGGSVVLTADFNHDGKLDFAVTHLVGGTLSIWLGNGNGTFQSPITYNLPSPGAMAIADFNGDGKLDLAIGESSSGLNKVSILLGAGDGTFGSAVDYAVGSNPSSIAVGNFTGHGEHDLAVANYGAPFASSTVSILLSNGNGTFQPAVNYDAGVGPSSVIAADFSSHGTDDVVVASTYSNAVAFLGGNGDGTFRPASAFSGGIEPFSLGVGDFNRDGKPDLMVGGLANILFELLNDTP